MIRKILMPLDGSLLAEHAIEPGLRLAEVAGATLILVGAVVPTNFLVPDAFVMGGYGLAWPNQSEDRARAAFTSYFKQFRKDHASPERPIVIEVAENDPATAIVELAETHQADLIVMSSHGYSGLTRFVMGSVAERVLHGAPCPVLIKRGTTPLKHMLIPLDGSPLSEGVLETALTVARGLGCRVTLFEAIEPLSLAEMEILEDMERGMGSAFQQEQQDRVRDYLHEIAKTQTGALGEVTRVVVHGPPAETILEYARTHAVDLIAMSTHGRTGLQRWMYGSVTEKVLRAATDCSMLIARPRA